MDNTKLSFQNEMGIVKLGYDGKVILDNTFIDCGTYWLSTHPQRTEPWFELRKHFLSASNFGTALGYGLNFTPPKTPEKLANIMKGLEKEEENEAMRMGTKYEDKARDLYSEFHDTEEKGIIVKEVGSAIPKWDKRLLSSTDGLVGEDGCMEIKCPEKMYKSYYYFNLDKMFKTHKSQSHGHINIYDKKWCDYMVYAWEDDEYFERRIYFDQKYWKEDLYPGLDSFLSRFFPQ